MNPVQKLRDFLSSTFRLPAVPILGYAAYLVGLAQMVRAGQQPTHNVIGVCTGHHLPDALASTQFLGGVTVQSFQPDTLATHLGSTYPPNGEYRFFSRAFIAGRLGV